MSTIRYYFATVIDDDKISALALLAKHLLQHNQNVVKMFVENTETLYGRSPRHVLFLMRRNNTPIFSVSPSSGNNSSTAKSTPEPSTPLTRNPNVSSLRERHLSLDDTNASTSQSSKFDISTPVLSKTKVTSSKDRDTTALNLTVDETAEFEEASPLGPTRSPEVSRQDSPRSKEIALMTSSLTLEEKNPTSSKLGTPELYGDSDVNKQESPRSAKLKNMTPGLTTAERDESTVLTAKVDDALNVGNQELPIPVEMIKRRSNDTLTETKSLSIEKQIASSHFHDSDSLYSGEKVEMSINLDLINKESVSPVEGMEAMPRKTEISNETHSLIKRSKTSNISPADIQEFTCPTVEVGFADCSPEDTQLGEKSINLNEASEGIVVDKTKRKSPTPKKRNAALFKLVPRVIQWDDEDIDIEVSCDSEDYFGPSTSLNTDYRVDKTEAVNSPNDSIKSPIAGTSKSDNSPKTIERCLSPLTKETSISSPCYVSETNSPLEGAISFNFSRNISGKNSPSSDDDTIFIKRPSEISSIITKKDRSCKSESSLTSIEIDSAVLAHMMFKFGAIFTLRDKVLQNIFSKLLQFQNTIKFLISYVRNVMHIVQNVALTEKAYTTKDLKEVINHVFAIASKLKKKLTSWETDIDLDINTFQKCFREIQQLKANYEETKKNEEIPQVTFEAMQVYEGKLRAIWKNLDDMIMIGDVRRSLFSQTAHEFEKLMALFPKCLILVGILLPR